MPVSIWAPFSRWLYRLLLFLTLAALLMQGCSAVMPPDVVQPAATMPEKSPTQEARTPEATQETPPPLESATVVATEETSMPAEIVPTTETPAAQPRFPAGWGYYSNPDFVEGLALQGETLWVASLGGVTRWDLETGTHTLYTTQDGLVEIQANDIAYCPAPQERIYVAHETGTLSVYELEQKKWVRLPITFEDGSTLLSVQRLRCDAKNNRLIAGSGQGLGILSFDTGKWKHIGHTQGLLVDEILGIDVAGQSIWVAAGDKGVSLVIGDTVFPFSTSNSLPRGSVYDITVDESGSLWMAYPGTLVRYKDRRWSVFGDTYPVNLPFRALSQVEAGADGSVWIASPEQGVCRFDRSLLICSTVYPGLRGYAITSMTVGADGMAYAGTNGGGVLALGSDRVTKLTAASGELISNDVMDIAESADGRLWIATGLGVNVFDPTQPSEPWQAIVPARSQLAFPRVSGLQPVAGGIWFFYQDETQASFFDGKNWLQMDAYKGLSSPVQGSAVDQRGYLWLAAQDGLHIWDGSAMRSYGPSTGLPGSSFRALYQDSGVMWVGTDRGLLRYERFQWERYLPDVAINMIAADRPNGLLLGTDLGLIRFIDGQSYQWLFNLDNTVYAQTSITAVAWDLVGHLWVGTRQNGLFHYDGKQWEQFDTSRGMPTNSIRKIFVDSGGTVWIIATTGKGGGALVRYTP